VAPRAGVWINLWSWGRGCCPSFGDVRLPRGPGISRFRVRCGACHRTALARTRWHRSGMAGRGACRIPVRSVKAIRLPEGNNHDLARRTPAPYRFRRSFSR
jgi:hypothetical protein